MDWREVIQDAGATVYADFGDSLWALAAIIFVVLWIVLILRAVKTVIREL